MLPKLDKADENDQPADGLVTMKQDFCQEIKKENSHRTKIHITKKKEQDFNLTVPVVT